MTIRQLAHNYGIHKKARPGYSEAGFSMVKAQRVQPGYFQVVPRAKFSDAKAQFSLSLMTASR